MFLVFTILTLFLLKRATPFKDSFFHLILYGMKECSLHSCISSPSLRHSLTSSNTDNIISRIGFPLSSQVVRVSAQSLSNEKLSSEVSKIRYTPAQNSLPTLLKITIHLITTVVSYCGRINVKTATKNETHRNSVSDCIDGFVWRTALKLSCYTQSDTLNNGLFFGRTNIQKFLISK